ncbi:apoptosis-resistant E3 ubiquitin protein ligase 1-like isoform X2 [Convolutriloba macropyga]|uniref:apoptosis-resistant E3 ubiquitin protein ligase 1-like isoform X2 n=1 Tax=Convolutriloba macropyga TaxID=536237 RepID=UPI003F51D70B
MSFLSVTLLLIFGDVYMELLRVVMSYFRMRDGSVGSSLLDQFRGNYFDERKTELQWGNSKTVVGESQYFDILLFKGSRKPYNLQLDRAELIVEEEALVHTDERGNTFTDPLSTTTSYETSRDANENRDVLKSSGVSINILIEFQDTGEHVMYVEEISPEGLLNAVRYSFRPRRAGSYAVTVVVNQHMIDGRPYTIAVLPDVVSAANVRRTDDCSVVVADANSERDLEFEVEMRDKFDNVCSNYEPVPMQTDVEFSIAMIQTDNQHEGFPEEFTPVFYISKSYKPGCCLVNLVMQQAGCFTATVSFQQQIIHNGVFEIIFLTETEKSKVDTITDSSRSAYTYFKSTLLPANFSLPTTLTSSGEQTSSSHVTPKSPKTSEVYCYFSGRHLVVAKWQMLIFRRVIASFRLTPSTKMQFLYQPTSDSDPRSLSDFANHRSTSSNKSFIQIDDGIQMPVRMFCQDRNVLAASFVRKMLKNIGGSESFKDKRQFFKDKLERHCHRNEHSTGHSTTQSLTIKRESLVDSSISAIGKKDVWSKMFVITFVGEEGQDCGGLRKEWMSSLCSELFGPQMGMFKKLNPDDPNSPLHPASGLPKTAYKYLEFAGRVLAKSLLESTIAPLTSQASLPDRLSKAFIAQIIGLRVNISHLEVDDPDLYKHKVKYILENDVTDLEMTFTEEENDPITSNTTVHKLIPHGHTVPVTNENKKFYLDQLVQFKLVSSTKAEVDEFRRGFEAVIPSELLSLFSENEVELMLCGASQISVADFQANCDCPQSTPRTGSSILFSGNRETTGLHSRFSKTLGWFWCLVENMTQEELGLLLQFITGSCRLPVGGFKELQPQIEIRQHHSVPNDHLPIAHTCFNRLLLPIYTSYQSLQKMVLLALNEGSTGFGLA